MFLMKSITPIRKRLFITILIVLSLLVLAPSCSRNETETTAAEATAEKQVKTKDISHMSDDEIREMQKQADEDFYQAAMENAPEPIDMQSALDSLFIE